MNMNFKKQAGAAAAAILTTTLSAAAQAQVDLTLEGAAFAQDVVNGVPNELIITVSNIGDDFISTEDAPFTIQFDSRRLDESGTTVLEEPIIFNGEELSTHLVFFPAGTSIPNGANVDFSLSYLPEENDSLILISVTPGTGLIDEADRSNQTGFIWVDDFRVSEPSVPIFFCERTDVNVDRRGFVTFNLQLTDEFGNAAVLPLDTAGVEAAGPVISQTSFSRDNVAALADGDFDQVFEDSVRLRRLTSAGTLNVSWESGDETLYALDPAGCENQSFNMN